MAVSFSDDVDVVTADTSASEADTEEDVVCARDSTTVASATVTFDLPSASEGASIKVDESSDVKMTEHGTNGSKSEDDWRKKLVKLKLSEYYNTERMELNFYHSHLKHLPDFNQFPSDMPLKRLILRQNLLSSLKGLRFIPHPETVIHLDLYLNTLPLISKDIALFTNVTWLDLSFNSLRLLSSYFDSLVNLTHLYLVNNKIKKLTIEKPKTLDHSTTDTTTVDDTDMDESSKTVEYCPLHSLRKLEMIELGSNRLRSMKELSELSELKEMWLGKNKITQLNGLSEEMKQLRLISIQSNRLQQLGPQIRHVRLSLEELYLSHNGFKSMDESFQCLVNLKILDISGNQLTRVCYLNEMTQLRELWLNDNLIETWDGILPKRRKDDSIADTGDASSDGTSAKSTLSDTVVSDGISSQVLATIYLERNPIQGDNDSDRMEYRRILYHAFPSLKQIDADRIIESQRADVLEHRMDA